MFEGALRSRSARASADPTRHVATVPEPDRDCHSRQAQQVKTVPPANTDAIACVCSTALPSNPEEQHARTYAAQMQTFIDGTNEKIQSEHLEQQRLSHQEVSWITTSCCQQSLQYIVSALLLHCYTIAIGIVDVNIILASNLFWVFICRLRA